MSQDLIWVDSHCHFDFAAFANNREQEWLLAQAQGIVGLIIPGISKNQGETLADFCQQKPWFFALGLHPYFMQQHQQADLIWLENALQNSDALAVGEIGLDNVIATTETELNNQWQYFDAQIHIAKTHKKSVILHIRGMHDQACAYLRKQQFTGGGIVHAFSGSEQQAKAWLDLGFSLGIGGAMTHARAQKLRKTIQALPTDAWLLETDSPDMKPAFWQGECNSPVVIPFLAAILATLKQQTLREIALIQQHKLLDLWPELSVLFRAR